MKILTKKGIKMIADHYDAETFNMIQNWKKENNRSPQNFADMGLEIYAKSFGKYGVNSVLLIDKNGEAWQMDRRAESFMN